MRSLISLAIAASLAAAAPAVVLAAAKTAPAKAAAPAKGAVAAWTVDKAASKLGFKSSFNGEAFEGSFKRWDATIAFDPKNLAASKVTVTVDTGSAVSGDDTRDESLPTDEWFNAAKFPRATYTTSAFKDLGGGKFMAEGVLAINGVSKPATLNFTLAIQGDVARVNGTATVMRNAYGVGQGQFAAADTIPYSVTVPVALVARRAK